MEDKEIKKTFRLIDESLQFGKKKIIYHENSHFLMSAILGFELNYVDYTVITQKELKNENLEIIFESQAHASFNLPELLENLIAHFTLGGTLAEYSSKSKIEEEILVNLINSYLTILLAGYTAEEYFFNREDHPEYAEVIGFIDQFSMDLTRKDLNHDIPKAKHILNHIGFKTEEDQKKMIDNIKDKILKVISDSRVIKLFERFELESLKANRISKDQFLAILNEEKFESFSTDLINLANS